MGQARPDVPPGLCQVIDRALAKSPADRFQSIAELATALGPFGLPESGLSVRRIEATWLAFHPGLAPAVTGGAAAPAAPMMITRPRGGADVQSTVGPVAVSGEAPGHGRSVFLMSAAAVAVALGIVAAAFFAFTRSTASVASPQDDRPAASSSVAAAASPPPVESVPGAPLPSAAPSSLPAVAPSVPAPVASSPGRPSTPRAPAVPQKAPSRSRPRPASEVFDSRK